MAATTPKDEKVLKTSSNKPYITSHHPISYESL